jgi:hypothetical protein
MKKNLLITMGTLVLITIFFAPSAFALGFGASADYWIPTFKGDLRVDNNSEPGTEINLKEDLGISNENIPGVEAYFGIGNHEITVAYSQVKLSGTKKLNTEIKFNGITFAIAEPVESELKTNMIDLEYQYKLINFKNILAGLSLGIIAKVKYFDGEASMHSLLNNTQKDIRVPIPMIGVGAKIGLLEIFWKHGQRSQVWATPGTFFMTQWRISL